jgi:putative ABC transport system permease protein
MTALLAAFVQDLRGALRLARRTPGVTVAAVLALALGIGANTAIFSVVDGVLLRPLPFPDSQALYRVFMGNTRTPGSKIDDPLSLPQYQDVVTQSRAFQSIGAWGDNDANLTGGPVAERVLVRFALPSLLPTLQVAPALGRGFLPEEAQAGRNRVALISHALWQRQFAGDQRALGASLRLDGVDYRVVGVLPRGFQLERPVDVWMPLDTTQPALQVRNWHVLSVVARLKPGATPAAAAADLDRVARYQTDTFPEMFPPSVRFALSARPYLDTMVGDVRLPLLVLLAAVGFVLVITCANVANLLLARAAARQREMAVRTALGASRGRLIRQLMTESLLLSALGSGLGVVLATWGLNALVALSPATLPRMAEVALDLRVLLFTGLVAIGTGVAFGLAPAIAESRPRLNDALKEGMFGSSAGHGRVRKALVIGEVAICLVLLVGAGLMLKSFVRLRDIDPGFRPDHALTFRVSLPKPAGEATEADRLRLVAFYDRALARLRQLPGVVAAGAGSAVPLDGRGGFGRLIDVEGYTPRDRGERPSAQLIRVTPGWFAALGIPVVGGRAIEAGDRSGAAPVLVVNQAFVRRFFPDGRALGRQVRLGKLTSEFPWAAIVGVVGDVHTRGLDASVRPEMYWPVAQSGPAPGLAIVLRTVGDPGALAAPARAAMAEVDPTQPIFGLQTVEQLAAASLAQRRFTLTLMLVFGVVALALASVGLYGVMAYTVAQRTREIGIRVALGARPAQVLGMVVGGGMTLVAAGTAIGTAGALAASRVAAGLLYGVSSTDVTTYLGIAGLLAAVALLATILPARRAMRVDPLRALRAE